MADAPHEDWPLKGLLLQDLPPKESPVQEPAPEEQPLKRSKLFLEEPKRTLEEPTINEPPVKKKPFNRFKLAVEGPELPLEETFPAVINRPLWYAPQAAKREEDLQRYRPGGFHPVALGDVLQKQFRIIHKLGTGGNSTVWLAYDSYSKKLVAVRILSDHASSCAESKRGEISFINHLLEYQPSNVFLELPSQLFWVSGPNGRHLCFVLKIQGPSIARMLRAKKILPVPQRRQIALQAAQAVSYLHSSKINIVHGDLTTNNILLELDSGGLDPDKAIKRLGAPRLEKINVLDPEARKHAPEFLIHSADLTKLSEYFTGNIKIIDFGGSFYRKHHRQAVLITPPNFCAPEWLRNQECGKESDIWALACLIFELRAGFALFQSTPAVFGVERLTLIEDILRPMEPSPQSEHDENPSVDARPLLNQPKLKRLIASIGKHEETVPTLFREKKKSMLSKFLILVQGKKGAKQTIRETESVHLKITEQEVYFFHDLLQAMLNYDKEERPSIRDVLRHPWFSLSFDIPVKGSSSSM